MTTSSLTAPTFFFTNRRKIKPFTSHVKFSHLLQKSPDQFPLSSIKNPNYPIKLTPRSSLKPLTTPNRLTGDPNQSSSAGFMGFPLSSDPHAAAAASGGRMRRGHFSSSSSSSSTTHSRSSSSSSRSRRHSRKSERSLSKRFPPIKPGDRIDYSNIGLISRFISEQGKILPRRVSRLSLKQQRSITAAIKQARILSLLPFLNTERQFERVESIPSPSRPRTRNK